MHNVGILNGQPHQQSECSAQELGKPALSILSYCICPPVSIEDCMGWMGPPESLAGSAERPVRCMGCAIYNPANGLILQELLVQAKLYQNAKCKR